MELENSGQQMETTGAVNNGQTTKRVSGADMGQRCGAAENMKVGAPDKAADWCKSGKGCP